MGNDIINNNTMNNMMVLIIGDENQHFFQVHYRYCQG